MPIYYLLALLLLLSGCATIKPTLDTSGYDYVARVCTYASVCDENDYISPTDHEKFLKVLGSHLSNYTYDTNQLDNIIKTYVAQAAKDTDLMTTCISFRDYALAEIVKYDAKVAEDAGRAVGYNRTMQAFSDTGTSLYQQNMSYGSGSPIVVPPVTFGQQQNQTRYYRVNGPDGTKNCTVTASGYTYCN